MTTIAGHPADMKHLSNGELRALHVHRHAGIFRPLQDDERERLRASIKSGYDQSHPIIAWSKTKEIVDGRNRRDLAVELDCRDVPVAFVAFTDEAAVTAYVVAANLARRHLTTKERADLAGRLVLNGASTRSAAKATGVSKDSAQRAAAKARAGVSTETPRNDSPPELPEDTLTQQQQRIARGLRAMAHSADFIASALTSPEALDGVDAETCALWLDQVAIVRTALTRLVARTRRDLEAPAA